MLRFVFLVVMVLAAVVKFSTWANEDSCLRRWDRSGLRARWESPACLVEAEDGRWIPESAVQIHMEVHCERQVP